MSQVLPGSHLSVMPPPQPLLVRVPRELLYDTFVNLRQTMARMMSASIAFDLGIPTVPDGRPLDSQTMRMLTLFVKYPWQPWHLAFLRCQLQSSYGQEVVNLLDRFDDMWQRRADMARTRCRKVRHRFLKQHKLMVADAFQTIPF